ncbi:MAG: hypothetical protein IPM33_05430 [Phycisphaerales bacterium]|nr:hypothetical protein [Phycisphaerales bacterium]
MNMRKTRGFAGAVAAAAGLACTTAFAQVNNPELEVNDSKATATIANSGGAGMANADYITGTSTGTSTLAGPTSADYFRVRTALAPLGVYRHRLAIDQVGNIGTIRGLPQTAGVIGTTDSVVQTSSTVTTPPRMVQWYGFGKGEEIYYRVTGTTSTTGMYTATLSTSPVAITDVSGTIAAGNVTIQTWNIGNTTDTDFWVYDSNFNALSDFGNDDESIAGGGGGATLQSICTRNLSAGTYYLALSNWNFANNMPSPADDDFRSGIVLDFPDAAANSSTTATAVNLTFRVTSDAGVIDVPASRLEAYGILWFRLVVGANNNPTGIGSVDIATADNCGGTYATYMVTVTPGQNPPSSGLGVVANFSSLGGSSSQMMFDDGTNGDVTPGDNVFTYAQLVNWGTTTGAKTIPFTVSDAESRSTNGNIGGLSVSACTTLGACCVDDACQVLSPQRCNQLDGSYQGDGTNCGTATYAISTTGSAFEDISGTGTSSTTGACDDCVQSGISIGFDFGFFDNTYNTVNISSNGNLQFTSASTLLTNVAIPNVAVPNNMIAPLWDDWNPNVTIGEVYYLTRGTAPNREFIVSWQNVAQFGNTDSNSFQAVLFEGSNNIEFRYGQITPETPVGDYTAGIENIDGTIGHTFPAGELGGGFTARMFTYIPGENPCGGSCPWSSGGCIADYNGSGGTPDDADVAAFFDAWNNGDECSDANGSGGTPDDADVAMFFELWNNGGC